MFFDYQVTTSDERSTLMAGPFEWITIDPEQIVSRHQNHLRGKPIAWMQDTNEFAALDYSPILKTLRQYDVNPAIRPPQTEYWKYLSAVKRAKHREERINALLLDYAAVKQGGVKALLGANDGICVEATGETLAGEHRAIIACHLGIEEIDVKLFKFEWRTVDEAFLRRKSRARELSFGPCYYSIDYGPFKSLEQEHSKAYEENARDRWETLLDALVQSGERIVDVGCNEGYNSLRAALKGCDVLGVDRSYISGAWLNKLIFEWSVQQDLKASFVQANVETYDFSPCDTALVLNVIYHLSKDSQIPFLERLKAQRVILQGNLRKLALHDHFHGITIDDMSRLLTEAGYSRLEVVEWRDKPVVIGHRRPKRRR